MTGRRVGLFVLLLATTLAPLALADSQVAGEWGHGHMWDYGWGWMFVGPLMMIAVIAAAVAIVVVLVRWLGGVGHTTHRGRRGSSALDILEERFARGEIDRDEFDERKRTLTG